MTEAELMKDLRRRMDGALDVLRKEFGGLRTGRASASLLEPVQVEAYGSTVPLSQVASITGGQYISVTNANSLNQAFQTIAKSLVVLK